MHSHDFIHCHYLYHYSSLYILEEYNQPSLDSLLKSFHFGGFTEWFLSLSFHNRLGIMLTYETTHEYYLGDNTCLHYCAEHGTLIVTPDHCDRVLLTGIDKSIMLDFARNLVQKDLEETLSKYNKDAESKDVDELNDKELLAKLEE